MVVLHSFEQSLAKSAEHVDAPFWLECYRKAFPSLRSAVSVRDDGWAQRGGIDRVITLECGRTVTVDEKVREKDYGDILLEYWSNKERRVRGWICKPLACDFIAYAIVPRSTCYLMPTLGLQAAWRSNAISWNRLARTNERGFRLCEARNQGYTTSSIAIPTAVVMDAIRDAMVIEWTAA